MSTLSATVLIDEAQRMPELFPVLRVLVDEDRRPGRFLVLGSASPDLVGLAAESLAGRVTLLDLGGFGVTDVGAGSLGRLWERGGLPPAYLAPDTAASADWRRDYVRTFLERDLAGLGILTPATTMRRFWTMLAHYHAQTWNGAIYVRDSGLLHSLLHIATADDLLGHPKVGASWEGFVIEQLLALPEVANPWFWATHTGAELDLLVEVGTQRVGIEVKRTDRPKISPSMRNALADLALDRLLVVHAGAQRFPLGERIDAVDAATLLSEGLSAAIEHPPG